MSPFEDLKANLAAMIMPAFVLGNAIAAVLMRHTRSAMLQVLSSDYVRTARAKGLDERVVVLKHALRNALMPIITLGALEFGTLLSGAVLTEQVFTIPGFGKLIVDAVFNRDYAVVQGVVLFTATAYITLNLLADIAYFLVNPRMRGCRWRRLRSTSCRAEASPGRRALRAACRGGAARWSASSSSSFFVRSPLLAPWIAPYDPLATSWRAIRKAPSAAHWFGTDEIGRDVLSRVDLRRARVAARRRRVGARSRCRSACRSGLLAGYVGRWTDVLISRMTDAMLATPFLILAIALAAFLGPSLTNAMIAIGISATPIFIRLTRAQVLSVKVEDFIEAARAVGNPHLAHRVAPRAAERRAAADRAGDAGDRGRGDRRGEPVVPRPRAAAAGAELGQHAQHREELHRARAVDGGVAGLSIFVLVLSFNLLGDGLRDALDPRHA